MPAATAEPESSLSGNEERPFLPAAMKPPNQATIAAKALGEILWHPITYIPIAGIAVSNALVSVPLWVNAPLVALAIAAEMTFWKKNWTPLYEKHESQEERKYRTRFNKQTLEEALRSSSPTYLQLHQLLREIFATKEAIELQILSDARINTKEREILDLIQDTTLQVTEASRHSSIPTEEMNDALATIQELHASLEIVIRPLNPTAEEKKIQVQTGLAQTTQALRHRMEESKHVRKLVEDAKKTRA